jgi:MSHA pilin protein MshD
MTRAAVRITTKISGRMLPRPTTLCAEVLCCACEFETRKHVGSIADDTDIMNFSPGRRARFIGLRKPKRRRGISLAECLIALTILPLAVTAIAYAIVSGQQESVEALRQERAAVLAEALMEEILADAYADPQGAVTLGPDAGETARNLYDNMDDYHGFSETAGAVKNAAAVLYPSAYQSLSRSVSCEAASQTLLGITKSGLSITVSVADAKGTVLSLTRFVSNPS